jgi:DNA-binding NarL/FixJ family response regulator
MDLVDSHPARKASRSTVDVVVVDDHPAVRDALTSLIDGTDDLTLRCAAATVSEAVEYLGNHPSDVVIVDLDGIALLNELNGVGPVPPVIVYSKFDSDAFREQAETAGAAGYVAKCQDTWCLIEAVRQVAAGGRYFADRTAGGDGEVGSVA